MKKFYQERSQTFRNKHEKVKKRYNSNSFFRGIAFIALIWILVFYFRSDSLYALAGVVIVGIVFYLLVLRHRKLVEMARYYDTLMELNEEEIKRIDLDLSSFETGGNFLQEDHPYQSDLDIFGNASLYQTVNRCEIDDSKDLLARWLSSKSSKQEICLRQESAKELSNDPDWCHDFSAKCRMSINQKRKHEPSVSSRNLINWINKSTTFQRPGLWKFVALLSNFILLTLAILVIAGLLPYQVLYIPIILNAVFLGITVRYMKDLIIGIDKSYYIVSTYQQAMECLETKNFKSDRLTALKEKLNQGNISATKRIESLAKLTHRLSSRANMIYIMADVTLLLDAYLLVDLYNWKKKNKDSIETWLTTVNEVECLISLAGFKHVHQEFIFPEISDKPFYFKATNLGHPLIPMHQKVTNDYSIDGKGSVDIITGSNMSGKSTFQRTIGINMVLAQMGGPVDASKFSMGLTKIFTSMRTKDNLAENTSSFYAELKRIRQLLDNLEKDEVTFFLLDEILKGTNSEDRQKGAVSLAKKLTKKPAFGLISTHDLALGRLASEEKLIRNYSFNSEIDGNKITFDYKITEGICKSFNASKLMENMGIM